MSVFSFIISLDYFFIYKQNYHKLLVIIDVEGFCYILVKVRKMSKVRNRYNQVPHLAQATMGKWQEKKHHIQESQEVSPFPAGDHKAARNRQNSMTNTNPNNKKDPQKKHHPGMVSKKNTGGLKHVSWYQPHP